MPSHARQLGLPQHQKVRIEGTMTMTATVARCLLALAFTALLAGCAGNHKFDDDEYRPLGDPKTATRDA